MNLSPVPGCPEDVAAILHVHWERVLFTAREVQRRVPDPKAHMLVMEVLPWRADGSRTVKIRPEARRDAWDVPFIGAYEAVVAEPAPNGMIHLVIVVEGWTHHTLVPLPTTDAPID